MQVFHVSFVKPRVLSLEQIKSLQGALSSWTARSKEALLFLEEHSSELLATGVETA